MPAKRGKREAVTSNDRDIQKLVKQFKKATGSTELDIDEFVSWAEVNDHFKVTKSLVHGLFRRMVTRALCKEFIRDDDGELVRSQHPFRYKQLTLWKSMEDMTPDEMRGSYQVTRTSVKGVIFHKQRAIDHFNKKFNPGDPVQTCWDFDTDWQEEKHSAEFNDQPPSDDES